MSKKSRNVIKTDLVLKNIRPKNEKQSKVINSDKHLILAGEPGTGKTFLAVYKGFSDIFNESTPYKTLICIRSAVGTRKVGFFPGTLEEKTKIYEEPFIDACSAVFGREDAYLIAKSQGLIHYQSTTNIRGQNLEDAVVIVDEFSNLNYHELRSVITRLHGSCKIIFSGDVRQSDIPESSGYDKFVQVISSLVEHPFDIVIFESEDIVRSGLVKEFIINESRFK